MPKAFVFYNPLAGSGKCKKQIQNMISKIKGEKVLCDITLEDSQKNISKMEKDDYLILCGGDGTVNHFINREETLTLENDIYYYPSGSGNDFANDLCYKKGSGPILITEYIKKLPVALVNGIKYRFINGVGTGIDGYCCKTGNALVEKTGKKQSYTKIAIKGLLYDYKPKNCVVTVDGVKKEYKRVWLAPIMHGRYFGGGMMVAPSQNRKDDDLSCVVVHNLGRLAILFIFLTVFKGLHVKFRKVVEVIRGKRIEVSYNSPTPLQIDGETPISSVNNILVEATVGEKVYSEV